MTIEIIFKSHATSTDNENGIASGHNDSPLSPKGISQASDLGMRYGKTAFCKVFCSDLMRSNATAKIAFNRRDIEIILDQKRLNC
jgi:broad specificity phosphatase PhoE